MVRKKDRFWSYVEDLDGRFKCNFCQPNFAGGASRIKYHLAGVKGNDVDICTSVPEDVQKEAYLAVGGTNKKLKSASSSSNAKESKTTLCSISKDMCHATNSEMCGKKDKNAVDKLLAQLVTVNNISFDVVQTTSFIRFVQGVAEYGPDYKLPSYLTFQRKLIPDLKVEVEEYIRNVKKSWLVSGCTLMSNIWSDVEHRAYINIIAYSPSGVIFLKSLEVSRDKITTLYIKDIISSIIEEIGSDNVVQLITDNTTNFESAGDLLISKYPWLYKTQCAAYSISLLLKEICKEVDWVQKTIIDAKSIVSYMYKDSIISSLMREYTNHKELKHPCKRRFSSNFLMLRSILNVQDELQLLVVSSKWKNLNHNEKDIAKVASIIQSAEFWSQVKEVFQDELQLLVVSSKWKNLNHNEKDIAKVASIIQSAEFWSQVKEVLLVLEPLVRVLRLVDNDLSTAGYLYEAMEMAKETIKQQYDSNQDKYMQIWKLFSCRYTENIMHPIHAAATFLNPAYLCSEKFIESHEMKDGISFILENLVAIEEREDFMKEVQLYRNKVPSLFTITAKTMLKTSHPRIWWDFCGDRLPILQKYAIRILSQPCSSTLSKGYWNASELAQTKKTNMLTSEMLDNMVNVRLNSMMMEKFNTGESRNLKPIDLYKPYELPEYVDHEQFFVDDALSRVVEKGIDD